MPLAPAETWKAFYEGDLQAVLAPLVVPALFLLARALVLRPRAPGVVPARAAFVDRWAWIFGALTILDPLATGPLVRALGWSGTSAGLAVTIAFVLLGDFRFYALVFGVADPHAPLRRAALWTLLVPVIALPATRVLHVAASGLPDETIWLVYELCFFAVALFLRARWVPRHARAAGTAGVAWLRRVAAYAALYYGLWAAADALILAGGLDVGWLLRVLPNQLYYAFFVPFVWLSFFARDRSARNASTSASAHAAR